MCCLARARLDLESRVLGLVFFQSEVVRFRFSANLQRANEVPLLRDLLSNLPIYVTWILVVSAYYGLWGVVY